MDERDRPVATITLSVAEYEWVLASLWMQHQINLGNSGYEGQQDDIDATDALLTRLRRDAPPGVDVPMVAPLENGPV